MYPLPLDQHGTLPIEYLGLPVLVICLVVTLAWLLYFYR